MANVMSTSQFYRSFKTLGRISWHPEFDEITADFYTVAAEKIRRKAKKLGLACSWRRTDRGDIVFVWNTYEKVVPTHEKSWHVVPLDWHVVPVWLKGLSNSKMELIAKELNCPFDGQGRLDIPAHFGYAVPAGEGYPYYVVREAILIQLAPYGVEWSDISLHLYEG